MTKVAMALIILFLAGCATTEKRAESNVQPGECSDFNLENLSSEKNAGVSRADIGGHLKEYYNRCGYHTRDNDLRISFQILLAEKVDSGEMTLEVMKQAMKKFDVALQAQDVQMIRQYKALVEFQKLQNQQLLTLQK